MSDRTTSPANVNANVATVVPPYIPLTNNPAYDALIREGQSRPELLESADNLLAEQHRLGVTQADVDLELAFYAAEQGAEVCAGTQATLFRQKMGYVVRCAAELDAWSNSADEWANYHASNPAPETADAVLPVVEQAASVVEQAPVEEAVDEEAVRKASKAVLSKCVTAYKQGEDGYKTGLLESGRLCAEYIAMRLSLGEVRSKAVRKVESELDEYSSTAVDAGRLAKAYHAYRLLAVECGLVDAVAYGKGKGMAYGYYRDQWSRLVEIRNTNTPKEAYVLIQGMEAEAQAVFATVVKNRLSLEATKDKVTSLLQQYAAKQAAETAVAQAKATAEAAALQQAAGHARIATQRANTEVITQQEELAKATDDAAKARVTANMEAAKEELLAKQAAERLATEVAAEAARVKAKADKDAAEAKALAEKQAAAAKKAADKQAEKDAKDAAKLNGSTPATKATVVPNSGQKPEAPAGGNLLRAAKAGTVKDVAEMAVELITGGDSPDDVLEAVLNTLATHKELSKVSQKAVAMALSALKVAERRVTITLPAAGGTVESNGHAKPVAV